MRTELRGELSGLRGEVTEITGLRGKLHTEMTRLEENTLRGFTGVRRELDGLNRRLDNLVEVAGGSHRDHEARIAALEGAVSRLSGR